MRKLIGLLGIVLALLLSSCGGGGGYAGDTGPTNELRMSPLLDSAALPVGYFTDLAVISQGVQPYYVMSSDASVRADLLDDGTLRVWALSPGQSQVSVQDSSVSQRTIKLTVESQTTALISSVGSAINLTPNQSKMFTIAGGVGPYAVISSDDAVATVAGAAGSYVVTGHLPGTANLQVTDAFGQVYTISVNVNVSTLVVAPTQGSGVVGTRLTFGIAGGVAPYAVSVLNPSVANATLSASTVDVGLLAPGATQVAVRDAIGTTVLFGVTVTVSKVTVNPETRTLSETAGGGNITYALSGDAPPFRVSVGSADRAFVTGASVSADNALMTATLGSNLCITGGDRMIQMLVIDAQGTSAVATLVIKDQGKNKDDIEIPCP